MYLIKLCVVAVMVIATPLQAAWFEATGQAIIHNGNKELARQQATQEAIRQALLFAGASVRSVQQMADGLLQDERFEVRASGEVSKVELINEQYHGDYVEIAIRADIFPQERECSASDYKKSIATTHLHMSARHHAAVGGLYDITDPLAELVRMGFEYHARHAMITQIEPYSFYPKHEQFKSQIMMMSEKTGAQFILLGDIVELSVANTDTTYLDYATFWKNSSPIRNIGIKFQLMDGATGDVLLNKTYRASAVWQFDLHQTLDVHSKALWQSPFGNAIRGMINELTSDADELLACKPAHGRVIGLFDNALTVNIGSKQGVQKGDELSVFQMRQFFTPSGAPHFQYNVHPSTLTVSKVFFDSAVLRIENNGPLANIQPNDFVVRQ